MRRLALSVALLWAAGSPAQEPKDPPEADAPEQAGRLTLAIDPGWHTKPVQHVAFTPEGLMVTYSGDHTVRITDVVTNEQKVIHLPGRATYYGGYAGISANGRYVAAVSEYPAGDGFDRVVHVVSLPDGKVDRVLRGINPKDGFHSVSVSPDGKLVALGCEAGVAMRVWGADPAKPLRVGRKGATATAAAFSPDGKRAAVTWNIKGGSEVSVHDTASGAELAGPVAVGGLHVHVAWSPDGKTIATAGRAAPPRLWSPDMTPGATLPLTGGIVHGLAFSPDSTRLLFTHDPGSTHHRAFVYDIAAEKLTTDFNPTRSPNKPASIIWSAHGAAFAPDGKTVVTSGGSPAEPITLVWNPDTGDVSRWLLTPSWVRANGMKPAWSADGRSISWNDTPQAPSFHLTDLTLGPPLGPNAHGATKTANGVTLKGTARYQYQDVVKDGTAGGTQIVLANMRGWTFLTRDKSDRVVVGGYLGRLSVFDTATGKEVQKLKAHTGPVTAAASPDGKYILSTSHDQTVRVWRPDRETPLLSLFMVGREWVVWTPEGYYAASPNGERLIGWKFENGIDDAPSHFPAEQFRSRLNRPDVIRRVLDAGPVAAALAAADGALPKKAGPAPRAVTSPESLLPPGVTITVDRSKLPLVTVTATARTTVAEQRIKSLRLMMDGRRLPEGKGFVEFAPGKESAAVEKQEWTVELPPGRHTLSVLARSADDTPGFSNPVEVLAPAGAAERPAVHVLAVGVSQYQKVRPNLSFAHTDAARVKEAFAACAKGGVAYRPGAAAAVRNAEATRQGVLDALTAARAKAKAGDLFVFFFAGHGTREGGEFFLLTHDADPTSADTMRKTAVPGSELRARLADFPCQVLVVLDACHSGQVGGLPAGADEAARGLADPDVRVAVMCAALGHETAKEADGAGVFTSALSRALEDGQKAGVFFDRVTGELNVYHLQAFVYQEVVRAAGGGQTPYLRMPLGHPAFTITQFAPRP